MAGLMIPSAMSFSLCYWILMLIWLIFGLWSNWPATSASVRPLGGTALLFILLVLLGWQVFGPPIRG